MRKLGTTLGLGALAVLAVAVQAQAGPPDRERGLELRGTKLDAAQRPAARLARPIEVFVQLDTPSVAAYCNQEIKAGRGAPTATMQRRHAQVIRGQQASLRQRLRGLGARELAALRVGANGLRIRVDGRAVGEIRRLPGVKTVAPITQHWPTLDTSVPWIGVPEVWASHGDGSGVTIAVIDTGIDYLHANFGGAGDPLEYAANDPNVVEPGTFETAKVIGGTDFAGPIYNASSNNPAEYTPMPDEDPLDVNGHGSHVAGIAAGLGVPDSIGPGAATGASLYALKVFGDVAGSTSLTSDAIEWALDPNDDGDTSDHVDVINMSLGSDFGSPNDPSAIASQNAVELGVIVVASSGNAGNVPYVTGSPGVAPDALSVAASYDGGFGDPALQVDTSSAAGLYPMAVGGVGPPLSVVGPITGQMAVADPLEACGPLDPLVSDVAGKIALVQRGSCSFTQKHQSALDAGAIAIVVFNNDGDALVNMGGNPVDIAGVFIGETDGLTIQAAIEAPETVNATLDSAVEIPQPGLADTMASFTSRGPGHGGSMFKPEVSAPGVGIRSTGVGTGDRMSIKGGTSMAAPHIAGVAALLRQIHPELSPVGIKSLIMNSAVTANLPGTATPYALALQGTGVTRANTAAGLTAYTEPAGVTFGRINPAFFDYEKRKIRVHNLSGDHRHFSITHVPGQTFPGVTVHVPSHISVPPGRSKKFTVKIRMDASAGPPDDAFFSQTEVDGWFVLNDGDETLRVGYVAVVDPASWVVAWRHRRSQVKLFNLGRSDGIAEGFTLAGMGGELLDDVPNAIDKLGVRTNVLGGYDVAEFGLVTEEPWETLSAYEVDIEIDTDEDPTTFNPGFVLVAADLGLLQGGDPIGQVVTALLNLSTGSFVLEYFAGADLNDKTAIFSVDLFGELYGFLEPGDTTFDYRVLTFDLRDDSVDVQMGSVDLANEILPQTPTVVLAPGEHTRVDTNGGPGKMLWLFQNNRARRQSGVVRVK